MLFGHWLSSKKNMNSLTEKLFTNILLNRILKLSFVSRVTRLGEISLIGQLFKLDSFFENCRSSPNFGQRCAFGLAMFLAFFVSSSGHPVSSLTQ
jgi:hypothetical protein